MAFSLALQIWKMPVTMRMVPIAAGADVIVMGNPTIAEQLTSLGLVVQTIHEDGVMPNPLGAKRATVQWRDSSETWVHDTTERLGLTNTLNPRGRPRKGPAPFSPARYPLTEILIDYLPASCTFPSLSGRLSSLSEPFCNNSLV